MKGIYPIGILIVLLFVQSFGLAQVSPKYDINEPSYVNSLMESIESSRKDKDDDFPERFGQYVASGQASNDLMRHIAEYANSMDKVGRWTVDRERKIAGLCMLFDSIKCVPLDQWHEVLSDQIGFYYPGKESKFDEEVRQWRQFARSGILTVRGKNTWRVKGKASAVTWSTDKGLILSFDQPVVLQADNPYDTMALSKTTGIFYGKTYEWQGAGGEMDWVGAGIPKDEAYVRLTSYNVKTTKFEISCDSVLMNYPKYSRESFPGVFKDRLDNQNRDKNYPDFLATVRLSTQQINDYVSVNGGFHLTGNEIGVDAPKGEICVVEFRDPSSQKLLALYKPKSLKVAVPNKIFGGLGSLIIFTANDSIFHPAVEVEYKIQSNTLEARTGLDIVSDIPFTLGNQNMIVEAEILRWPLDSREIEFNLFTDSRTKSVNIISDKYFSYESFQNTGMRFGNSEIEKIYDSYSGELRGASLSAKALGKILAPSVPYRQQFSNFYRLMANGFIGFNEAEERVDLLPKIILYVEALRKTSDFDEMGMSSYASGKNVTYDVDLDIATTRGVSSVMISEYDRTSIYPDNETFDIDKDKSFNFSGMFTAGQFEFLDDDALFEYEPYHFISDSLNELRMDVLYNNPNSASNLLRVKSVIEGAEIVVSVNSPDNHSGTFNQDESYPKIETFNHPKVFYSDSSIRGGDYNRDSFYFSLDPFTLDSLFYIDSVDLSFIGTLTSAYIFPTIRDTLMLMNDKSLGIKESTGEEGISLYQDRGLLTGFYQLDRSNGVIGTGTVDYLTSDFSSKRIEFFTDSVVAFADSLNIERSEMGFLSPEMKSEKNKLRWFPYEGRLVATSNANNPFSMNQGRTLLEGTLQVTDTAITADGAIEWSDAKLTSEDFTLTDKDIMASSGDLEVKSGGDQVTFSVKDVSMDVDMDENYGTFISNSEDNFIDLAYNAYRVNIREFQWDIDARRLFFRVPEGQDDMTFFATNPSQGDIFFNSGSADYDMSTSSLEVREIPFIDIADSRLYPNGDTLYIKQNGVLSKLEGCTLTSPINESRHQFSGVSMTIKGRNEANGKGSFIYNGQDLDSQLIVIDNIKTKQTQEKKESDRTSYFHASGELQMIDSLQFMTSILGIGDVAIDSRFNGVHLDGFLQIDWQSDALDNEWVKINDTIYADSIGFDFQQSTALRGETLYTGIYLTPKDITPFFPQLLSRVRVPSQKPLLEVKGMFSHKAGENEYLFQNGSYDASIPGYTGNSLTYNVASKNINGQGLLDLQLRTGPVELLNSGRIAHNVESNSLEISLSQALSIGLPDEIWQAIGLMINEASFSSKSLTYYEESSMQDWFGLLQRKNKNLKDLRSAMAMDPFFEYPKGLKGNLVTHQVTFNYEDNALYRHFVSEGKIGISFIGEMPIHKEVKGKIVFEQRDAESDGLDIYIENDLREFVHLSYRANHLSIFSTNKAVMQSITDLPEKKRTVENNGRSMTFGIGSSLKTEEFKIEFNL